MMRARGGKIFPSLTMDTLNRENNREREILVTRHGKKGIILIAEILFQLSGIK